MYALVCKRKKLKQQNFNATQANIQVHKGIKKVEGHRKGERYVFE